MRGSNPFALTHQQATFLAKALILLIPLWVIFILGFKWNINSFGDEQGYHDAAVYLSGSLQRGTLLADLGDDSRFKYPGYYALAAIVYFVFGNHPVLLRTVGFVCYILLSIVIANASDIAGAKHPDRLSILLPLLSPTYFYFSMMLYRDIYVALGCGLILYALLLACRGQRATLRPLMAWPALLGYALVTLMRTPQIAVSLFIVVVPVLFSWVASKSGYRRILSIVAVSGVAAGAIFSLRHLFVQLVTREFFLSGYANGSLDLSHLQALDSTSIRSTDDLLQTLTQPKFLTTAIGLKLSEFLLGFNPFSATIDQPNVYESLMGNYRADQWGGYQWEDTLLVYGLQWIVQFAVLPLVILGIHSTLRRQPRVFLALSVHFLAFALLTVFTGNAVRWGLPNMAIFYIYASSGLAVRESRLIWLYLFEGLLVLLTIAVRSISLPIPMIVAPIALFILVFLFNMGAEKNRQELAKPYLTN